MALSTVAVGVLTFTYSQYSACRASPRSTRHASHVCPKSWCCVRRHLRPYARGQRPGRYLLLVLDPDRHFLFTESQGPACRTSWWPKSNSCCASGIHPMLAKPARSPVRRVQNKEQSRPFNCPADRPWLRPGPSLEFVHSCCRPATSSTCRCLIVIHRNLPLASSPKASQPSPTGREPSEPERCPISTAIGTGSAPRRSASGAHSGRSLEAAASRRDGHHPVYATYASPRSAFVGMAGRGPHGASSSNPAIRPP